MFSEEYKKEYDSDGCFGDYGLAIHFAIKMNQKKKEDQQKAEENRKLIEKCKKLTTTN